MRRTRGKKAMGALVKVLSFPLLVRGQEFAKSNNLCSLLIEYERVMRNGRFAMMWRKDKV